MLIKRNLMITFPVDLGNRTLESNLLEIFSDDLDFYCFASQHAENTGSGQISLSKSIWYRINSAFTLRRLVRKYTRAGKTVFFHGLSPALFSFGVWNPQQAVIAVDWTRNLYPSALGEPTDKNLLFKLHSRILRKCPKILCWTDAVRDNLHQIYGVDKSYLFKAPMPFLIDNLSFPHRITPQKPRVLFVGGDLKRKGGDLVLESWNSLRERISLTMMTNDVLANVEGVNFLPGVKYGSEAHTKAFEEHDILILPTKIDGYPQVVGEAAAAGLAVITTKYALGAKEVIIDGKSGYITESSEECIERLWSLLDEHALIDSFKKAGSELMRRKFSQKLIRQTYLDIINN